MKGGWIGVDFDGTLAVYDGWNNGILGKPIAPMVARVKRWIADGEDVRIFTARAAVAEGLWSPESQQHASQGFAESQKFAIEEWCLEHLGKVLPITATKDFQMIELWDDRAISVEWNTGRVTTERPLSERD